MFLMKTPKLLMNLGGGECFHYIFSQEETLFLDKL